MENISYFNEIIGNLNLYEVKFRKLINTIYNSKLNIDFKNPVDDVRKSIYALKEKGKESNFDMFGEDSYIKYIYISFLESLLTEMSKCLGNVVTYINSSVFSKITHKKLVNDSIRVYMYDYLLLKSFNQNFVMTYFNYLLLEEGHFDYFKPGMFYKFAVFVMNDIKKLDLNEDIKESDLEDEYNRNFIFVMNYIKELESRMKENNENINYDSYNEGLEVFSKKYHVDFISLDRDYDYQVGGLSDEENCGYSK